MSRWGWSGGYPGRETDPCPSWLRTASMLAPWISLVLLAMTIWVMGGVLTGREGIAFNLPEGDGTDAADASMSVLIIPSTQGTLVFFDDTRYLFDDERQMDEFAAQLAGRAAVSAKAVLLVLADRRVKGGELVKLADIARKQGVGQLFFAEKTDGKKARHAP